MIFHVERLLVTQMPLVLESVSMERLRVVPRYFIGFSSLGK